MKRGTYKNTNIQDALHEAEQMAWKALSRYKFMMFGYWAGIWVHLNHLAGGKRPNPFRELVKIASETSPTSPPSKPPGF